MRWKLQLFLLFSFSSLFDVSQTLSTRQWTMLMGAQVTTATAAAIHSIKVCHFLSLSPASNDGDDDETEKPTIRWFLSAAASSALFSHADPRGLLFLVSTTNWGHLTNWIGDDDFRWDFSGATWLLLRSNEVVNLSQIKVKFVCRLLSSAVELFRTSLFYLYSNEPTTTTTTTLDSWDGSRSVRRYDENAVAVHLQLGECLFVHREQQFHAIICVSHSLFMSNEIKNEKHKKVRAFAVNWKHLQLIGTEYRRSDIMSSDEKWNFLHLLAYTNSSRISRFSVFFSL